MTSRGLLVLSLVSLALASCSSRGSAGDTADDYSDWTTCPHVAGYSLDDWRKDSIGEKYVEYEWENKCTFRFTGDSPQMVEFFHQNPNAD